MRFTLPWLFVGILLSGCASPLASRSARSSLVALRPEFAHPPAVVELARRMDAATARLAGLARQAPADPEQSYSPRELDTVEVEYASWWSCRAELARLASNAATGARLARAAQIRGDAQLVHQFLDDPRMSHTLNSEFHRSDLPRGTFDRVYFAVTAPGLLDPTDVADTADNVRLVSWSTSSTEPQHVEAEAQRLIQEIRDRQPALTAAATGTAAGAWPAAVLAESRQAVGQQARRARAGVMRTISRLKSPTARPLTFSAEQKAWIRSRLQPGDVLLTYTAGVASNVFLPGQFKHAITFVGTPAERACWGVTPDAAATLPAPWRSRLLTNIQVATLSSGEPADLVESLAEGVIFGNLDVLLDTRVNRLVVLRPRLQPQERRDQLLDVLSFVGDDYDFYFDFTDPSDQVCTEVVYRSLQGRGGLHFPLRRRGGRLNLTADDILAHGQAGPAPLLDTILSVDADPQSPHLARIHAG